MSNKRNAMLTNAAFYAVLLFCLVGVGAGAYLLLFPSTTTPTEVSDPLQEITDIPDADQQITEIIQPVIVPENPTEEEPTPVDVVTPEPSISESEPVSAPVTVIESAPQPSEPVVAVIPDPVVMPLEGDILAAFSMDTLVYNETLADWRTHDGIDIAAEAGTGVLAAAGGTVADIREDHLLGTTVVIQHSDGYRTTYASLAPELAVKFGERVSSGQLIGAVSTSAAGESAAGPHLHFSVSKNGTAVDPTEYLNA